jgi:hypothetical protein
VGEVVEDREREADVVGIGPHRGPAAIAGIPGSEALLARRRWRALRVDDDEAVAVGGWIHL